jgi:hypothetical protein
MKIVKILIAVFLTFGGISTIIQFIQNLISSNESVAFNIGYIISSLLIIALLVFVIVKLVQSIIRDFSK